MVHKNTRIHLKMGLQKGIKGDDLQSAFTWKLMESTISCEYCGKTFKRCQNLSFHLKSHGTDTFPSKFTGGKKKPLRSVMDQKIITDQ